MILGSKVSLKAQTQTDGIVVGNTETEIPEDLKYNYDILLDQWIKGLLQETPDSVDIDDEPVFFSDSTYANRLYNMPSTMELSYNDEVKKFIHMYAGRNRNQVSKMLALGKFYFPIFEEALDKADLPLELKYLPCIESALNPIAKSRAGATGLWQFMSGTGKAYKLEINSLVDERRDPYKSTDAAVKYLKDMYNIYGDWNLVIAAYNCGPGNVNKAIAKSGGQRNYWKIYPYLPKETRGYVPAFIAATYIMNFNDSHNIHPAQINIPLLVDTIKVEKKLHLKQISEVLHIPIEDLRALNPKFKTDIIPGGNNEYTINLPISYVSSFINKKNTIYNYKTAEFFTHSKYQNPTYLANNNTTTHRVRKGETLTSLASKYGLTKNQLKKMNGLTSDRLTIGKVLRVSDKKVSNNLASAESVPKTKIESVEIFKQDGMLKKRIKTHQEEIEYITVQSGETWHGISRKTGASIANIKKWNNINGNILSAGKKIKIIHNKSIETIVDVEKPQKIEINKQELINLINSYIVQDALANSIDKISQYYENNISNDSDYQPIELSDIPEIISSNTELSEYHDIFYGETITKIANHYGITEQELLTWNGIDKKSDLRKNITKLRVKKPNELASADKK